MLSHGWPQGRPARTGHPGLAGARPLLRSAMPEQCRVPAIGAALILASTWPPLPGPACVFRGSSPGGARYCRIEGVACTCTYAQPCMVFHDSAGACATAGITERPFHVGALSQIDVNSEKQRMSLR